MSTPLDGLVYDQPTDRIINRLTTKSSHRDATTVSRGIGINTYLTLLGRTRSPAMEDIGAQWNEVIGSGRYLYVTNWTELKVVGEARAHDRIVTKLYVTRVSSYRTRMSWEYFRESPDGLVLVAIAEQDTAFTRVIGHGQVEPTDMPDWLRVWLERQLPLGNHPSRHIAGVHEMAAMPELPLGPVVSTPDQRVIFEQSLQTSTLASNIGGNVYYQNYFEWMIGVTDAFFHSMAPAMFRNLGCDGEALIVGLRMEFLREIMPLDWVHLELRALEVGRDWAKLEVTHRSGEPLQKAALGTVSVRCVRRDQAGDATPMAWPGAVLNALLPKKLGRVGGQ